MENVSFILMAQFILFLAYVRFFIAPQQMESFAINGVALISLFLFGIGIGIFLMWIVS